MWEALIWAVPVAVLVAGLRRPDGGLLILAASLPLFGAPPGGPYLAALDAAALAAIATAWRAGRPARSVVDRPAFAFLVASAASALPLLYHPPSWRPASLLGVALSLPGVESWSSLYSWRALLNLLLGWLLFLSVRRAFAHRSLRPLALAFAAGLASAVLIGLAEHLGGVDLSGYRPIGAELYEPRLHSMFFHSGWLGEYLILLAPLAVAGLMLGRGRGAVLGLALLALTLVTLVFTAQRGAWVAAACQLGVLILAGAAYARRDRRWLVRAVAVGLVSASVVVGLLGLRSDLRAALSERVRHASEMVGRRFLWKASVEMFSERPALGWGVGGFAPAYGELGLQRIAGPYDRLTAHNQYLMVLVERGAIGLAAFGLLGWAIAAVSVRLASVRRDGETDRERVVLGRSLALGMLGWAVYGLVQYLFFLKVLEWAFWIGLGAMSVLGAGAVPQFDRWVRRATTAVLLAVALLLPWRILATPTLDTASNRAYGFHRSEPGSGFDFEWTTGRAARRLVWQGETLILRLANGHPQPARHRLRVAVSIDGREVARPEVGGDWTDVPIHVGAQRARALVLELRVAPTFRPFSELGRARGDEGSRDIRSLGVAFGSPRWE